MNRQRQPALLNVLGVFYFLLVLGGIGLHFWTVGMAYHLQGTGIALVTFFFPVGAEIFWAIKEWRTLGLANLYTLSVIWYGVCCLLLAWGLSIVENTKKSGSSSGGT